jgi:hypothetical protein
MSPSYTYTTAVIGGGIAGITASRLLGLANRSSPVLLFDRGNKLGGRASERRVDDGEPSSSSSSSSSFTWHYGYQGIGLYPDASRLPRGARPLEGSTRREAMALLGRGSVDGVVVAESTPSPVELFELPDGVDVHARCNVVGLQRTPEERWRVTFERSPSPSSSSSSSSSTTVVDQVVIADWTAATGLLRGTAMADRLQGVSYRPMFAYLARLRDAPAGDLHAPAGAFSMLKLRREPGGSYVCGYTSPEMTARILHELPMADRRGLVTPQTPAYRRAVAAILDGALVDVGIDIDIDIEMSWSHRWGRALPVNAIQGGEPFLYDERLGVGVCGDMFCVDGAAPFDSARASAAALVDAIGAAPRRRSSRL